MSLPEERLYYFLRLAELLMEVRHQLAAHADGCDTRPYEEELATLCEANEDALMCALEIAKIVRNVQGTGIGDDLLQRVRALGH